GSNWPTISSSRWISWRPWRPSRCRPGYKPDSETQMDQGRPHCHSFGTLRSLLRGTQPIASDCLKCWGSNGTKHVKGKRDADGWTVVRTSGSHTHLHHSHKPGIVIV